MKLFRFITSKTGARTKWLKEPEYTWNCLSEKREYPEDTRFVMGQGKITKDSPFLANGFMIDIDNTPLEYKQSIIEVVEEAEFRVIITHTGGGFHIYFPLKTALPKKEFPNYKASYKEFCKEYFSHLPDVFKNFDYQVFRSPVFGRAVGSYNTKRQRFVTSVYDNNLDPLDSINELLDYREIVASSSNDVSSLVLSDRDTSEDHKCLKYCGFIKQAIKEPATMSHEMWKPAVILLHKIGKGSMAHDISKRMLSEDKYDPTEVENLKNPTYGISCSGVRTATENFPNWRNICLRCPHNQPANSPLAISGKLPTPSLLAGFHKTMKDKDSGKIYRDTAKCEGQDIAHKFCNDNDHLVRISNNSILMNYDDGIYAEMTPNIASYKVYSYKLKEQLETIPANGLYRPVDKDAVEKSLSRSAIRTMDYTDFDDPRYIAFKNNVLDTETMEIVDFSPDIMLSKRLTAEYIPDKDYSWLTDILKYTVHYEESIRLIQMFAGLVVSNILNRENQYLLWLSGMPKSGKSVVLQFLHEITDGGGCLIKNHSTALNQQELPFDLRGKSFVYIDDFHYHYGGSAREVNNLADSINTFVSGAEITFRPKYAKPLSVMPKTNLFIASNTDPVIGDTSKGWARRVRLVQYNRRLTMEQELKVGEFFRNQDMRDSFLTFAIDGYKMCKENFKKTGKWLPPLTPPEEEFFATAVENEFADGSGNEDKEVDFMHFLKLFYVFDENAKGMKFEEIKDHYTIYANSRGGRVIPYPRLYTMARYYIAEQSTTIDISTIMVRTTKGSNINYIRRKNNEN